MPSLKSLVSFAHRKEENLDEMNTTYDGYMIMKSPLVSSFGHYSKNKASIGTQTDTTANHCQKCNEVQTCSRCRSSFANFKEKEEEPVYEEIELN
ncbi:hypothetical protein TUBRATIS_16150 [Tubulinosema ratisbonensis]|uniref:Uncharacterized protein n=1 Tax=Tubulinosema ratisbonensis TaxID=291195 RepID=A0A437AL31_9MICR|nr:hypothetical protein TUBRATIS_16150 [Tubulinosema ratisbonensis]